MNEQKYIKMKEEALYRRKDIMEWRCQMILVHQLMDI